MAIWAELERYRERDFRPGRDELNIGRTICIAQYVSTTSCFRDLLIVALLMGNALTCQHKAGRTVSPFDGVSPRNRRLHRVAGTPDTHVRLEAQRSRVVDRLVHGAILAQPD